MKKKIINLALNLIMGIFIFSSLLVFSDKKSTATGITKKVKTTKTKKKILPVKNGLILYFSFDEENNDTVIDKSSSENNGKIHDCKWKKDGKKGGMLSFDGSKSFIEIKQTKDLDPNKDLTISLWIKMNIIVGGWKTLVSTESFRLQVTDDQRIHWDWVSPGNSNIYTKPNVFPLKKWNHFILIKKRDKLEFYVNKRKVCTTKLKKDKNIPEIKNLKIGMDGLTKIGNLDHYIGELDEVSIFNRAITPSERSKLYRR